MKKTILYVDVDDTIIAQCLPHAGFDLRPGVVTQLGALARLFDCKWLTHWSHQDINTLLKSVYGHRVVKDFTYCNWRAYDQNDKAKAVLAGPKDFYWLEDPLSTGEMDKLGEAGLSDRYIRVDPKGQWGFTRAIRILFAKKGITTVDLKKTGANLEWFNEPLGEHFDWTYVE